MGRVLAMVPAPCVSLPGISLSHYSHRTSHIAIRFFLGRFRIGNNCLQCCQQARDVDEWEKERWPNVLRSGLRMSLFDAMSATAIGIRRDCEITTGSGNDRKRMG